MIINIKNVIDRELGAVLVVENARCLNIIAKLVDYKYKVVSLDGKSVILVVLLRVVLVRELV